jgi:hypothetical protein
MAPIEAKIEADASLFCTRCRKQIYEPHFFNAILSSTSKLELMILVNDEAAPLPHSRFAAIALISHGCARLRSTE